MALPRPDGGVAVEKAFYVPPGGEEAILRNINLTLAPGETLYLFSDGVTEAHDPAGELFSEERLEAALRAAAGSRSRDVVQAVSDALKGFVGTASPSDDITMLTLRRLDPSAV